MHWSYIFLALTPWYYIYVYDADIYCLMVRPFPKGRALHVHYRMISGFPVWHQALDKPMLTSFKLKHYHKMLDDFSTVWTPRYVDRMPTSEVTQVIIRYICPPHHDHTSQYMSHGHEWMTHIIFVPLSIGCPIPEIRLLQTLTLKLQGQDHGCGQWARSYIQPNILFIHFLFLSNQSHQQFPRYSYLKFDHPRSRSWVRSTVKITYYTQYPTDALLFHFTSIGPTIPEIWPK